MSASSDSPTVNGAYSYCENLLRDRDRLRWLACLFAPARARRHLHALLAFNHEIGRVRAIVSEPSLGEIRLQWWREAIGGERPGEARANPLSAALLATIRDNALPPSAFDRYIEARRFDLYNDPMPSLGDLEGYCGETQSAMLRLASIILCGGSEPGGADACGHGGVALQLTKTMQDLPVHATRGQCFLPKDLLTRHGALAEAVGAGVNSPSLLGALGELRALARNHLRMARDAMAQLDERAHPALVQLAVVEPLLKRMDRRGYDPFTHEIELSQWRAQWAMWRW